MPDSLMERWLAELGRASLAEGYLHSLGLWDCVSLAATETHSWRCGGSGSDCCSGGLGAVADGRGAVVCRAAIRSSASADDWLVSTCLQGDITRA